MLVSWGNLVTRVTSTLCVKLLTEQIKFVTYLFKMCL